jgi:hypothetical protein
MIWYSTKEDFHKALDEAMEVIEGKKGPKLTWDFAEDATYVYPERLQMVAELVGKLRSLTDHLPENATQGV